MKLFHGGENRKRRKKKRSERGKLYGLFTIVLFTVMLDYEQPLFPSLVLSPTKKINEQKKSAPRKPGARRNYLAPAFVNLFLLVLRTKLGERKCSYSTVMLQIFFWVLLDLLLTLQTLTVFAGTCALQMLWSM